MTIKCSFARWLVNATLLLSAGYASATEQLVLRTDQAKIIEVPRTPSIVVVGNPSIADATIQGNRVFLHGRAYGTTNVIILDTDGAQLADYAVDVQQGGLHNVSLFKAGNLQTYVCATNCETMLHVGDHPGHYKDVVLNRTEEKINLATGQRTAEANEPPPAQ